MWALVSIKWCRQTICARRESSFDEFEMSEKLYTRWLHIINFMIPCKKRTRASQSFTHKNTESTTIWRLFRITTELTYEKTLNDLFAIKYPIWMSFSLTRPLSVSFINFCFSHFLKKTATKNKFNEWKIFVNKSWCQTNMNFFLWLW